MGGEEFHNSDIGCDVSGKSELPERVASISYVHCTAFIWSHSVRSSPSPRRQTSGRRGGGGRGRAAQVGTSLARVLVLLLSRPSVRASDRPPRNGAAVSWRGPPELGRLYDFSEEAALKNPSIVSLSALEEDSDGVRRRRLFDIVPLLPHSNDASRPSSRASPSVQPSFELGGDERERSLSLSANLLLHPYLGPSYLPPLPPPLPSFTLFWAKIVALKSDWKADIPPSLSSLSLSTPSGRAGGRALPVGFDSSNSPRRKDGRKDGAETDGRPAAAGDAS